MKFTNIPKSNRGDNTSPVRFISIGDSVTKNLTLYEYKDDIIAVDYGIGFPEGDDYGVDFVIPDMAYLVENAHKVKALFISHAHADHFAAVPYLLRQLNVPIYANRLTIEYIKEMLDEKENKNLKENISFHHFDFTTEPVQLGAFKISAFNVNHSVPDSMGLVIDTPEGIMLHLADFKVDFSPVIDKPIDLAKIAMYGEQGVLCLASDSMGSRSEGFVVSEVTMKDTFPKLFQEYEGQQLFITTISSNIARMHQIIDAAVRAGRKVVPTGRSIDSSIDIARSLGYLKFDDDAFVDIKKARDYVQDSLVYIIAGCFGQPGSALDRLSRGDHHDITIQENAILAFSAEPNPPGVDIDVERVTSDMILRGVEVLDRTNTPNLHISGHGHKGDLSLIATLAKPKFFIPIGGSPAHLHSYANMIVDMGVERDRIFELQEGEVIEFLNGNARRGKTIPVTDLFIDGTSISPIVIKDRELLSTDGVFVVVVPISKENNFVGKVDVITRGFVYVKESKALLGQSRDIINKVLDQNENVVDDWGNIKNKIEKDIQKYLYKETRRNPLVIVHSIFV